VKKILIVGAGGQGAPCASILARDKDTSEIVLGDIDLDLVNKVKNKIGSDKVTAVKLDAGKVEDIERAARGVNAVINLTLCQFNSNIMDAAVKSGAHYVDAAFGEPIWQQLAEKRPLEFDNEFKRAGLTALVGCGGSPGITNVLTRYICDKLDRVDAICIRDGTKCLEETKEVVSTWEPDWSPEIALADYAAEPIVFEEGKHKIYPPFSGCEEYNFPAPVGSLLISYHIHEEVVMLSRFIGKGIKHVEFKFAVDPVAGALVKMGFANLEPINVKGVRIVPLDVLMQLIRHPVEDFFNEDENVAKFPSRFVEPMVIEIRGAKSGEDVEYKISWLYSIFTNSEEKLEFYRKFGTTAIAVALPAIVGAKMCMEGEADRGVIAPECLGAVKFLKMMAELGAPVNFYEACSKKVSIS